MGHDHKLSAASCILTSFVEHGHAPSIADLAAALNESPDVIKQGLIALEEYHGVVLHPASKEIWVAHPFSAAPTNFWVQTSRRGWWANCAWCAMGVVHLVGGTATTTTTLGAQSRQVTLHVDSGRLREVGYLVHFPVPMSKAWDNVVYTCSTMLLFDSEQSVDDWSIAARIPRGDTRPLAVVLEFAKAWYGQHLQPDWTKWSAAEAAILFKQFNLDGPIWQIEAAEDRF
jgi:hypothetical protein